MDTVIKKPYLSLFLYILIRIAPSLCILAALHIYDWATLEKPDQTISIMALCKFSGRDIILFY